MSKNILFLHIPKTAGTSFRLSAEEYFGKDNTFYDYAIQSKETSKEILDLIYKKGDPYRFYLKLLEMKHSFFSGHFISSKYDSLYELLNIVSFVRDPINQVVSHYNHHKNHHNYEHDFLDFIKEARFRNIQSKFLSETNIALYGFLGITEEYNTSVDMFNSLYGTKLEYKHMNVKNENSLNINKLDEKTLDLIRKLNSKDIELYQKVLEQFNIRKNLFANNLPFTYGYIQIITNNKIAGVAFQKDTDEPVQIDIFRGDIYLKTVVAKDLRRGLLQKNLPRKGFVGFTYVYKGKENLDGKLEAYVKNTGQRIN